MIIDIPNVGEVEFPDSMSEKEVNLAAKKLYDQSNIPAKEETGVMARGAQLLARGALPVAAGAGAGAMLGGAPGALIGSMAVPLADAATLIGNELNKGNLAVENYLRNLLGMQQREITPTQMPSQSVSQGMAQLGLPEPTSMGERAVEAAGGGLAGVGSQLPALARLATTAASPMARNIAGSMAQAPLAQTLVAAPAAATGQMVGEATDNPLLGMLAGGTVGAAGGIRGQVREVAPTARQLKDLSEIQYTKATNAGVIVSPESLKSKIPTFTSALKEAGYDSGLHPQINAVIDRLNIETETPKTLKELETLRRIVKAPTRTFDNPDQQRVAYALLDEFDDYVKNLDSKDLVGKAKESKTATDALSQARNLYARSKKSDVMSDILERAEIKAGANFTQSGLENALRQELKSLALNPKRIASFTQAEQDAIKAAAKGGNVQNVMRSIGKYAPTSPIPSSLGGGAGAGIGAMIGGVPGAVIGGALVPAVGGAGRAIATKMGLDRMRNIQDMVALGRMPEVQPRTRLMGVTGIRGLLSSPEERQRLIDEETNLGQ